MPVRRPRPRMTSFHAADRPAVRAVRAGQTSRKRWGRAAVRLAMILLAPVLLSAALAQDDGEPGDGADTAAQDAAPQVARLTVEAAGAQSYDLSTGRTVLEDGGTITDLETGLTIRAPYIAYVEGESIEARDAEAETDAGLLRAPRLSIDVPALRARAPEGVTFQREGLEVRADSADYRLDEELVRFERPRGSDPRLEAEALIYDARDGDALLLGPYLFQDGAFTLRDERSDAVLQLRPVEAEDGTPGYRAANTIDDDLWARVAPLR
ncbi:MAG: hypothetical protein U5K81_06845 [Trueperaceae bacterium]|nr:hypothetical protein [Trueperaceae bacterium]